MTISGTKSLAAARVATKERKKKEAAIKRATGKRVPSGGFLSGEQERTAQEQIQKEKSARGKELASIVKQKQQIKDAQKEAERKAQELTGRETAGQLVKISRSIAQKYNIKEQEIVGYLSKVSVDKKIQQQQQQQQQDLTKKKVKDALPAQKAIHAASPELAIATENVRVRQELYEKGEIPAHLAPTPGVFIPEELREKTFLEHQKKQKVLREYIRKLQIQ